MKYWLIIQRLLTVTLYKFNDYRFNGATYTMTSTSAVVQ